MLGNVSLNILKLISCSEAVLESYNNRIEYDAAAMRLGCPIKAVCHFMLIILK